MGPCQGRLKHQVIALGALLGALLAHPGEAFAQNECASADGARLVGIVWDQSRTLGLPGVEVRVFWGDGGRSSVSGPDGSFEICGLPPNTALSATATFGGFASPEYEFTMEPGGRHAHDFLVSLEATGGNSTTGVGRVVGRIVDASTGDPVAGAAVRALPTGLAVLTNDTGEFSLREVSAGSVAIEVRHVGYGSQSANLQVRPAAITSVAIRMLAQPIELEPLTVSVEGVQDLGLEFHGFYERQEWGEKLGLGDYLTFEDIERRSPRLISHMIADLPGTRLDCSQELLSQKCEVSFVGATRTSGCQRADVFIDGVNVIKSDQAFPPYGLDELVRPSEISGVEVYSGAASAPAEFSGASGSCGVIAIWTR